jgi:hypothetical protein
MLFMVLIFLFLLAIVVWAFVYYSPKGVAARGLLAFNAFVLAAGVPIGAMIGWWIYEAGAAFPEKRQFAWYLGLMAGGSAFMLIVTVAGLVRNFAVFPLGKRLSATDDVRDG